MHAPFGTVRSHVGHGTAATITLEIGVDKGPARVATFGLQNKASYLAVQTRKMADASSGDLANGDDLAGMRVKRRGSRATPIPRALQDTAEQTGPNALEPSGPRQQRKTPRRSSWRDCNRSAARIYAWLPARAPRLVPYLAASARNERCVRAAYSVRQRATAAQMHIHSVDPVSMVSCSSLLVAARSLELGIELGTKDPSPMKIIINKAIEP